MVAREAMGLKRLISKWGQTATERGCGTLWELKSSSGIKELKF
jgi:hypothetical protein